MTGIGTCSRFMDIDLPFLLMVFDVLVFCIAVSEQGSHFTTKEVGSGHTIAEIWSEETSRAVSLTVQENTL